MKMSESHKELPIAQPISYRDCLLRNINKPAEKIPVYKQIKMAVKPPPGLSPPPGLAPPPGLEHLVETEEQPEKILRKISPKLPKSPYPTLDYEINKIRALSSFKNNLIEHIIRYFKAHKIYHGGKLKYIRRQMMNHFPNWFFKLNIEGKVTDFLPQAPLEIQTNLDYIFNENQIEKKADFDPKMLTFNPKFIKDELQIREIITKTNKIKITNTEYVNYKLINNGPTWTLLPITKEQYLNMKKRYQGPPGQFDEYMAIILLRYKFLGGINNHLSIPPSIYNQLNIDTELFGSPFNVNSRSYCSPFPDIEKHFGSSGSFTELPLKSNSVYVANPPYDVQIVKDMTDKFERELKELENTTIYITIPLWRQDFPAHDMLMKSSFLKDSCELEKSKYPFYHYFKSRLIPASDTYLIVLSTGDQYLSCTELMKAWPHLNRKQGKGKNLPDLDETDF